MKKNPAILALVSLALSQAVPVVPAHADFKIAKPKPAASPAPRPRATQPAARNRNPARRPAADHTAPGAHVAQVPQQPMGYNPAAVVDAVKAIGGKAVLTINPGDGVRQIAAETNNRTWIARLSSCTSTDRCRLLTFSHLWEVSNRTNVCNSWKYYIVRDLDGTRGMPTCAPMTSIEKQLQFWLTSDQMPYSGVERVSAQEAQSRMQTMVNIWTGYLRRLPEARDVAREKCPKKNDKCW